MEASLQLAAAAASTASMKAVEEPLLSLKGICKSWGPHTVLDDLDLTLPARSLIWLAGANGAGKTTLLRIVCGLVAPDAGSVSFDGLDPHHDRRAFQRRLGFLAAGDRGIYARLSVERHLHLWARLALLPADKIPGAVERTVERLGIARLLPMRADRMSMGQRQRLRLALTFLHDPDLVLLDEPLNSLDEAGVEVLRQCIKDVLARGGTVVWCSPGTDRDQAPFQRRYWLADGQLTLQP